MKQRLNFSVAIVVLLTIYCGPVLAEREPEKPSDAKFIVWGTVEEIVRSETDENTNYEVRIRVEHSERRYTPVGKLFSVRVFQRKASAPREPAASGHTAIPKVGQRIRAWVIRRKDGTNHGIYPDWFHTVELNEQQRTAFDWVKSKGGRLGCDDSKPSRPIVSLDLYKIGGSGVRDEGLKHLAAFPELRKLNIGFSDPTAEGLRVVAQLKHLEDLTLHHARVSDEDFRGLEGMTSLTHLDASSTGITNRSLKQIATYTSLRTLRLTSSRMPQQGISDEGLYLLHRAGPLIDCLQQRARWEQLDGHDRRAARQAATCSTRMPLARISPAGATRCRISPAHFKKTSSCETASRRVFMRSHSLEDRRRRSDGRLSRRGSSSARAASPRPRPSPAASFRWSAWYCRQSL